MNVQSAQFVQNVLVNEIDGSDVRERLLAFAGHHEPGDRRLRAVAGDAGCHACHTHMSCSERCPKAIAPTASIAGLKRATALAALKGDL